MKIQFSKNGAFRITTDDGLIKGEFAYYTGVAALVYMGKTYIAVAGQYGLLPFCETVYEITEVSTKTETIHE